MSKEILVIDDDIDLNFTICDFLRDVSYSVDSVTDPMKIHDSIRKKDYEVVLLDLKMPGAEGTDFIRAIKEKLPDSKLIVMSGRPFINNHLAKLKLDSLVDRVLDKPFDIENLLSAIEGLVID